MVAAAFFMRCAVFAKRTQSFELFRSLPIREQSQSEEAAAGVEFIDQKDRDRWASRLDSILCRLGASSALTFTTISSREKGAIA